MLPLKHGEKKQEMSIITEDLASKVLNVVDQGLVKGLGEQVPGKMCVEAAVCYAMGLSHSDRPFCVGDAVRYFKIKLNDRPWPSDKERAKGLRKLAIAQLGSDQINQAEFSKQVVVETVCQILPIILTKVGLEKEAERCSKVTTIEEASRVTDAIYDALYDVYKSHPFYAVRNYVNRINHLAWASQSNIDKSWNIAHEIVEVVTRIDYRTVNMVNILEELKILQLCAKIGLDALIKLKSPGCEYLNLCQDN